MATVATSGSYNDLSDKPTIPIVPTNISAFTNDVGYITSSALSNYVDLTSDQTITGFKTFELGASIGNSSLYEETDPTAFDYTDFIISADSDMVIAPDANSCKIRYFDGTNAKYLLFPDGHAWSANKTVATTDQLFSGSYNDLTNKPTIPTKTSDLTNDSGFITSSALTDYVTLATSQTISGFKTFSNEVLFNNNVLIGSSDTYIYSPSSGSLGLFADKDIILGNNTRGGKFDIYHALTNQRVLIQGDNSDQNYRLFRLYNGSTVYGLDVPSTVGYTTNKTIATTDAIPTLISQLTNDSGFITGITSSDIITALGYTPGTSNFSGSYTDLTNKPDLSIYAESANLASVATSGDYEDLTNKPSIPSKTSDLTNDSGFITGITSGMVTTALGYTPLQSITPTSETWTFTLSDGTTTTKTIVTAVTSA